MALPRVLQVGTGAAPIPPTGAYGIERAIHTLSCALQERGIHTTLLDVRHPDRTDVPYSVMSLPLTHWESSPSLHQRAPRVIAFTTLATLAAIHLSRRRAIDVVHCHFQFPGGLLAPTLRRARVPVVYSVHNFIWSDLQLYHMAMRESQTPRGARAWLWLAAERQAIRAASIVTCQTEPIARNVVSELRINPRKVFVVPHALSDEWFSFGLANRGQTSDMSLSENIILQVARIHPVKNQLLVIRALARIASAVPSVRLVIVGPVSDVRYAQEVRHAIVHHDLTSRVTFLEDLSEAQLRHLYLSSQIFLLPSVAESSPASLLEAMASGVPVVVSDIATLRWLIRDGCGILVPIQDHIRLADAAIALLQQPIKRRELAAAAWQHAYLYHRWEPVIDHLVSLYQLAMRRSRR